MRDVKESEVRQAEIMDAALSLFIEKGYLNTTTQDIIDRVKISRGRSITISRTRKIFSTA